MTPYYDDGQARFYHGDALTVLRALPSASVHCCVTSPPYYGLRSYLPDGHDDKPLEVGLEQTPDEYVARLVEVFREVWRVLRDDGTLWLNLGDSYATHAQAKYQRPRDEQGNGSGAFRIPDQSHIDARRATARSKNIPPRLKDKDLIGIPWRVAFALQADGWYLRSDIIWHKPNPMPESVTDRPTKAHEYLFLLSKRDRYYYDADAIKERVVAPLNTLSWEERKSAGTGSGSLITGHNASQGTGVSHDLGGHGGGRNKRSVWTIATTPYAGAHFAVFPPKLIEPCILAGTSEWGVCAACGTPWRRVVERSVHFESGSGRAGNVPHGKHHGSAQAESGTYDIRMGPAVSSLTTGWEPSCNCAAGGEPATVLDPFLGSGTTAEVAKRLGRRCVGIDLNQRYLDEHAIPRCQQQALFAEGEAVS